MNICVYPNKVTDFGGGVMYEKREVRTLGRETSYRLWSVDIVFKWIFLSTATKEHVNTKITLWYQTMSFTNRFQLCQTTTEDQKLTYIKFPTTNLDDFVLCSSFSPKFWTWSIYICRIENLFIFFHQDCEIMKSFVPNHWEKKA